MDIKYLDFIGMYSEVYPDGFCNHVINEFEKLITAGHCGNRSDVYTFFTTNGGANWYGALALYNYA